jgi:hypothetical protein
MIKLSEIENGAGELVRAAVRDGTRSGDPLRMETVHLLGKIENMQSILGYAEQRGWIKAIPQNGKDYILTDLGFAAAQ